jgi:hypothetical protein
MAIAFVIAVLALAIGSDYFYRHRVVVEFGLLSEDPAKGAAVHVATTRISFRPNDTSHRFGLRFFKRSGRPFRASVAHVLPTRPSTLGGDLAEGTELPDGRYLVDGTEQEYLGGGVRSLRLAEGDSIGAYELLLYVNGKLRKVVKYQVVADAS